MNYRAVWAIYRFEMARTGRSLIQSIVSPVISTALYFVVFGAAIGSRITDIDGVSYGTFIVPGLIMLSLLTHSISNASFGIYMPRFVGTIFEILSAPIFWWSGLQQATPISSDYVPVFPWFSAVLFGIAIAQVSKNTKIFDQIGALKFSSSPTRLLKFIGRHS